MLIQIANANYLMFLLVSATVSAYKLSGRTSDVTATSDLTQQHVHLTEHQLLRSNPASSSAAGTSGTLLAQLTVVS